MSGSAAMYSSSDAVQLVGSFRGTGSARRNGSFNVGLRQAMFAGASSEGSSKRGASTL